MNRHPKDYLDTDWRSLHDGCSSSAKNILNPDWQKPLMRIAQAAMELEELTKNCTNNAPQDIDPQDYWKDPSA